MRSSAPIPGNPWPHDMSITVDEQPQALLELLWIREAHQLRPRSEDLPPLLSDTPPVVHDSSVSPETRAEWKAAWPGIWHAVAAHAGLEMDPHLFDQLHLTADGSPQRADLLRRIVGPHWRDTFGDSALADESYSVWSRRLSDALSASMQRPLEEHPERRDLVALVPAWRAGLTKVVTVPCAGELTRRIGDHALLMTARTRENSESYRRALGAFVT